MAINPPYRELNAAERRIEELVEIAMVTNYPGRPPVSLEEYKLITRARMEMAGLLLRIAVRLAADKKP